jgi:hypothetical protein
MKKLFLTLTLLSLTILCITAKRKKDDPRYEIHYKDVKTIENSYYSISFANAHSQAAFTKIKVTVVNKTKDYLIIKPSEFVFKYDNKTFSPAGKDIIVKPEKTKIKTFTVKGDMNFHVKQLSIEFNGFYTFSAEGKAVKTDNYILPPVTNNFSNGIFECDLKKLKKKTQITDAQFKGKYNGDNIGIVDAKKVNVKIESGQEFATEEKDAKKIILRKGDTFKFSAVFDIEGKICDMQFANMEILWKSTFSESEIKPIDGNMVMLEYDHGKTVGKNN